MSDRFGSGHHPAFSITESMRAQRESAVADATRSTASAAAETKDLIHELVKASIAAEQRETKMLFWARVAAWAGVVALVLGTVGIIVTLLAT